MALFDKLRYDGLVARATRLATLHSIAFWAPRFCGWSVHLPCPPLQSVHARPALHTLSLGIRCAWPPCVVAGDQLEWLDQPEWPWRPVASTRRAVECALPTTWSQPSRRRPAALSSTRVRPEGGRGGASVHVQPRSSAGRGQSRGQCHLRPLQRRRKGSDGRVRRDATP